MLYLYGGMVFNPLNAELNPICHLQELLGAHHIFHISALRVKRIIHYKIEAYWNSLLEV